LETSLSSQSLEVVLTT